MNATRFARGVAAHDTEMVVMESRQRWVGALTCALGLIVAGGVQPSRAQDNRAVIKAVINYSVAPWDDAAYELLIPLTKGPRDPNPFITINIWGNPEFRQPVTLTLTGRSGPRESGHAIFQSNRNESLPELGMPRDTAERGRSTRQVHTI